MRRILGCLDTAHTVSLARVVKKIHIGKSISRAELIKGGVGAEGVQGVQGQECA